ncbi:hypothetical protein NHE_0541 [Neorickettsia helminthoeca str. Oregon]|uniref:Uncharacterized protein n=1 Tax=Neorickettsia helminthoeca str. Oregon TaxID=1286528 RepID=X5H4J1_9RICK|nr:hypothetical protein NHE_0541 [Neorickettsia helminthoeca str. Oregon]
MLSHDRFESALKTSDAFQAVYVLLGFIARILSTSYLPI